MLLVKEVFVSSIPINLDFDPPSSVFWGLFLFNVEHVCTHSEIRLKSWYFLLYLQRIITDQNQFFMWSMKKGTLLKAQGKLLWNHYGFLLFLCICHKIQGVQWTRRHILQIPISRPFLAIIGIFRSGLQGNPLWGLIWNSYHSIHPRLCAMSGFHKSKTVHYFG